MMSLEFRGINYRTRAKLNALQQFHVGRRLAPILAVMGAKAAALLKPGDPEAESGVDGFLPLLPVMADVISQMPDAECEYVIFTCLSVVQRGVGDAWAAVTPPGDGRQLMFDDIDLDAMIRLVVLVLQENLAGFLPGLGGALPSSSS